jgi:hypothetical protein
MAQRTIVLMTCDLHGDETEATETITFGIGSERFELDCCAEHAAEVRGTLARYAGIGRRTSRGGGAGSSSGGGAGKGKGGGGKWGFGAADLSAEERDFAVASGWPGRGRIKDAIMQQLADQRGTGAA